MARRRFFRKRSSRPSFFARRTRRSSGSSSSLTPMNVALAGAGYGVARPMVANMLPSMFSFGPIDSDNAILGVAGYYAMKKGTGLVKALGMVTLAGEVSQVTSKLLNGTQSTSNSNGVTYYG